ncbi:MAG: glycosyltransferase family 39 protein [Tepidimonas sp.]|uniref:ArnT family glycosyltransferase n=1 Tax=Tepidimonas sp. TaxID=2002775 RepID=UPI00259E8125|nr:glycosyltransferase family 39 protein [Tepidimonas sp.]MDM7457550.1 glycosyltransferase family 39 protein [Tepidimonas sp.]
MLFVVWHLWAPSRLGITLHIDEAQYWTWSRELAWGYYSKPPVIAALIAASTALWGNGWIGVKGLTLALTTLTAWALAAWVHAMSGDARRGALAALLALGSPLVLLLGFGATTDVPLLLAWSLAAWALWVALQRPESAWRWALLGLTVGLGVLSKYTMLAFVPGACLAIVLAGPTPGHGWAVLRGGLLAAGAAALIVSPHVAWNVQADWPIWRHTLDITLQRDDAALQRGLAAFALGQVVLLGPLALALLAWRSAEPGDDAPGRHGTQRRGMRFALAVSAPLLIVGLAQAARGGAHVNWAAPALLGILAWLALRAPLRAAPVATLLGLQTALVIGLLHAPSVAAAVGQPWPCRLDFWARMRGWDQVWSELARQLPSEPALVVGDSRAVLAHGAYHWRDRDVQWLAWDPARRARHHFAWRQGVDETALASLLHGQRDRTVWLIAGDIDAVQPFAVRGMTPVEPQASAHWTNRCGRSVALWAWRLRPPQQDPS